MKQNVKCLLDAPSLYRILWLNFKSENVNGTLQHTMNVGDIVQLFKVALYLNNSVERSFPSEANSRLHSDSRDIFHLSCNAKFHSATSSYPEPNESVHTIPQIYFNIVFPSTSRPSKWFFPFRCTNQINRKAFQTEYLIN
jgi:hypothetical protein